MDATLTGPATDPWGQIQSAPITGRVAPVMVDGEEVVFDCPHCSTPLVPHHDDAGSLHCYDPRCVNCCFLPPDDSSLGQVRTKFEARPCPQARKVASSF